MGWVTIPFVIKFYVCLLCFFTLKPQGHNILTSWPGAFFPHFPIFLLLSPIFSSLFFSLNLFLRVNDSPTGDSRHCLLPFPIGSYNHGIFGKLSAIISNSFILKLRLHGLEAQKVFYTFSHSKSCKVRRPCQYFHNMTRINTNLGIGVRYFP